MPSLVDRSAIGCAVALNSAQFNLSRILGPAIAGAAIAAGGLGIAFWAQCARAMAVAAMFWRAPGARSATSRTQAASMWANLIDGVRYVRSRRIVAMLVLLAGVPAMFLLNYLDAAARLRAGRARDRRYRVSGCCRRHRRGALPGALGLAAFARRAAAGARCWRAGGGVAWPRSCSPTSRIVPVSVVALAILGGCQVLYYATTNTLLQVLVPGRLRGRVMSLYILTSWGLIPIGNVSREPWPSTPATPGPRGGAITLLRRAAGGDTRARAAAPRGRLRRGRAGDYLQRAREAVRDGLKPLRGRLPREG